MIQHQEHFGKIFYQDKAKGYWISTTYPRIRAHVWVWKNIYGNIPKGCHIHHEDENKSNNSIENLKIMDRSSHLRLHMMTPERKQRSKEIADKYRPLTKAWHASPEGKAWHKFHAIKCKFGTWEAHEEVCICCNAIYSTTKRSRNRFCSNACKSKYRREEGLDDVERSCLRCSKTFIANKYSKQKYCSRGCVQGKLP